MSTQTLAPPSPPSSPPPQRQRIAASPPLPELPQYYHATRNYQPRSICTCGTPQENTYFQPLIICRARAHKCPTQYYHAACVGEIPRHPRDTAPWYCAHCMSDDVVPTRVCTCDDDSPSLSESIVQCDRRAACSVRWYHRACVEFSEEEKWVCGECMREDREEEEDERQRQQQQQKRQSVQLQQPRQQPQKNQQSKQSTQSKQFQESQPTQQKRQKRQHREEPGDDEDSEPPSKRVEQSQQRREKPQRKHQHQPKNDEDSKPHTKRVRETQQKLQKRSYQDEPEDDEDAAPSRKRVRFPPDRVSEEPITPAESRAEASPERSERNPEDPGEQIPQEESPDEIEYCFCGSPSSMEMVACDGKQCAREWFHFECVGMTEETVPKGKWYCDECSVEVKEAKAKKAKGRKGATVGKKRKR